MRINLLRLALVFLRKAGEAAAAPEFLEVKRLNIAEETSAVADDIMCAALC